MNRLRAWYASLVPREQRIVLIGGIIVGVLVLVGAVLLPLGSAVSNAVARSERRRADLEWLRVNTPEIIAGTMLLPRETTESPLVLVDRVGRENGLENAFRGTQPSGTNGVRVQLEAAPFDTMIVWLAALEQHYGMSIDAATIERAAKPGLVNASVTLTQAKH